MLFPNQPACYTTLQLDTKTLLVASYIFSLETWLPAITALVDATAGIMCFTTPVKFETIKG